MLQDRPDLDAIAAQLREAGSPFVVATVVRTVAATAAKAGAKAIIQADGTIAGGWIGGGCARGATLKAAREVMERGEARLISVAPEDMLKELGVRPGGEQAGIHYAKNSCPSKGTMDIFLEPVLSKPRITIFGDSPVALAIADIAPRFGFAVERHASDDAMPDEGGGDRPEKRRNYIVVSTQGRGDAAALRTALLAKADHVSFVGSRAKAAELTKRLQGEVGDAELKRLKAPAGLDIGAITPEEIALSIVAEIVAVRRGKFASPDRP